MSQGLEDVTATDDPCGTEQPTVVVARTGRGWSVFAPGRAEDVDDLVEGMTLADLVSEELGASVEPDRGARRAARGAAAEPDPDADPRDARIAALERTVAQLEHALAARVTTERAIGALAERQGTTPQAAFEQLRRDARSQGRPVPELAREVFDGQAARVATVEAEVPAAPRTAPRTPVREAGRGAPHPLADRARARRGPVLTRPEPLTPGALADRLAALLAGTEPDPGASALRVAVDGPDVARPVELATALAERLPPLGRPAVVVPAGGFLRPASVRLEHGRTDPDARYTDWLDAGALAREVLDPVGPGGSGEYLPVLWDVERDRAARAVPRPMPPRGVLLVPGALLQGLGLAFDVVVHLRVAPAARRRRTPAERDWELPAFDRYDDEVDPVSLADAVVLTDSPDHPALVLQGRFT